MKISWSVSSIASAVFSTGLSFTIIGYSIWSKPVKNGFVRVGVRPFREFVAHGLHRFAGVVYYRK
jgi:hypothetical protein